MAKYGILADAQWCSGCHSCEVACQMEHGLPVGETGIKVVKIGPWAIGDEADENWQFSYLPIPTKQCDTCAGAWARCPPACSTASRSAWSSGRSTSCPSAWT